MSLSQAAIARAWGPGCYHGPKLAIRLFGHGTVTVRPAIGDAVMALDSCLRSNNYESDAADTGAYVCRKKTGGKGVSNHSFGTAIDLNWQENPYGRRLQTDMPPGMRSAIKNIRTNSGAQVWGWGGDWSGNKDAMHWEIVCSPADIGSGIRGRSVAQDPPPLPAGKPTKVAAVAPARPAPAPLDEEDDVKQWIISDSVTWYLTDGMTRRRVRDGHQAVQLIVRGQAANELDGNINPVIPVDAAYLLDIPEHSV